MDNKSELFDLKREKRELDTFLSTIADVEISASLPLKGAVQVKEALSPLAENKSELKTSYQEPSGLKLEMPDIKPEETFKPSARKDKQYATSLNEFIPKFAGADSLDLPDQTDLTQEKTSSFMSLDEGNKTDALPKITIPQGVKPLESFKTMTRFDGTTKSAGQVLEEVPLSDKKQISTEIEAEKKIINKASPYDFAPEKKGVGIGKWIWILIILLILLFAGYFWLSSKSSLFGSGSFFKAGQSVASSSVKEIKLLNVRQRLVYNAKLGKSIRVIEGIAENSARYPVSKIKIAANLYGSDGALLASMESFGGHILIDAKLESLDEAGLISDLTTENASEDKIPPKGQIPFMAVFTKEPAGVHKLSVLAVDFKKP